MEHFFILGKNKTLSLSEINSKFPEAEIKTPQPEVALFSSETLGDPTQTISEMGGVVKIGEISAQANAGELKDKILEILEDKIKDQEGKFKFGISYYGKRKLQIQKTGIEIKKELKSKGVNSRFVTSKDKTLSSVVVEQNKLTAKGAEIVIIDQKDKLLIGVTRAVQPFKQLSFRDYNRPARDSYSGMIPPKLAQIMINLTGISPDRDSYLLDPFCGSGTIATEAALMGWKNVIGTDTSEKAIEDASENMEWILEKNSITSLNWSFDTRDARQISDQLKKASVDAIVTEPYLGPQRERIDTDKTVPELEKLYSEALKDWEQILKPSGRIVMIWPFFTFNKKGLNPELDGLEIVPPLNRKQKEASELTSRDTIIYGRPDQKVWREIIILKKS